MPVSKAHSFTVRSEILTATEGSSFCTATRYTTWLGLHWMRLIFRSRFGDAKLARQGVGVGVKVLVDVKVGVGEIPKMSSIKLHLGLPSPVVRSNPFTDLYRLGFVPQ